MRDSKVIYLLRSDQIVTKKDYGKLTEDEIDIFIDKYLDFIESLGYYSTGSFFQQTEEEYLDES